MAVLSPALVVAMCVMFVLTRLHRHYYIFEHPFLFGLNYCLEPLKTDIENIMNASSASKPAQTAQAGKKKSKNKSAPLPSKPKISAASLTIRRSSLNEQFFSTEAEFPHHREFDHLMAISCGYLAAYAFEEAMSCFFPTLLANKRSAYVAVFGVGFAVLEALRISVSMTSRRILLMLGGIAWLIAMFLISAGDFANFVRFDEAFAGLGQFVILVLSTRLNVDEGQAAGYARTVTVVARFLVAALAALISASVAVPARHFSKHDYGLHNEYREDEDAHQDDPYYLGRPTPFTMLKIAMDYVIPAVTVFLWFVSPRDDGPYGGWRLLAFLFAVFFRFANLRIRLQMYLDGAIDGYRNFWTEKANSNAMVAGRQTTMHVISNSYFLLTIVVSYVAPALIPLLLTLVAKLDGAVDFGICRVASKAAPQGNEIFAREVAAFLAWWCIASYVGFACMSVAYEAIADVLDPSGRDRRRMKLPPATTSSEKRRQKRMMRQRTA